jgi:pyruvate formate lyase activating enzyme
MHEALFYEKLDESKVKCSLCSHKCVIKDGAVGVCKVRKNKKGVLYSLVYGRLISANVDPIEKKPLFHFLPGSWSFSIATPGCNFRCQHCQNYSISQLPDGEPHFNLSETAPERVVTLTRQNGCLSISHTYTEPTIFYEYAYDVAKLSSKDNIKNVFVTNGYMTAEVLKHSQPYLHAANVDLKAFKSETYKKICGARLEPVLESIRLMKELGMWVEVTTLVIPTINDSDEELTKIAEFLVSVDVNIPWHISRFHPTYNMTDLPPTPVQTLHRAREIGLGKGLKFVYSGNVPGDEGENTYCPRCKTLIIGRFGFQITKNDLRNGRCPKCAADIAGIWK